MSASHRSCSTAYCKNTVQQFKRCDNCREKDRVRRATLVERGICSRCERRQIAPNRTSCAQCLEFDRRRNKRRMDKYSNAGFCAKCGVNPPRQGKKTCEECGRAHKIAAEKGLCCRCRHEPATVGRFCLECKKQHIEWEAAQVKSGHCIKCNNEAVRGLLHCQRHRVLDREHTRRRTKRLRAEGKCRICTAPSNGKSRCPACQKNHTEKSKKRREELRAKGFCDCCGKRPFALDWRRCEECQERKNGRQRVRTPEQITADRARAKRVREATIAKGLCYRCMRRRPAEGRKTCAPCMEVQRIRAAIDSVKRRRARKAAQAETKRLEKQATKQAAKRRSKLIEA